MVLSTSQKNVNQLLNVPQFPCNVYSVIKWISERKIPIECKKYRCCHGMKRAQQQKSVDWDTSWGITTTGLSLLLNSLLRKVAVILTVKRADWFQRETINIVHFVHQCHEKRAASLKNEWHATPCTFNIVTFKGDKNLHWKICPFKNKNKTNQNQTSDLHSFDVTNTVWHSFNWRTCLMYTSVPF